MRFLDIYHPKVLVGFIKDIVEMRHMVITLSINQLQKNYAGSYLSILWAFLQPAATILILTFLFAVGFKSKTANDFPFELWLAAGMIPWFFFSAAINGGTSSIRSFSGIVKKMSFRVSLLPVVHALSLLYVHLALVVVLHILYAFYGFFPDIYNLQIFYFMFAMTLLILGITFATASISLFFRDLSNIISIIIQFMFWTTPIFWSIDIMPLEYVKYLELNPLYYITEGYRMSLIHKQWFWVRMDLTIYYWSLVVVFWAIGTYTFRKLKPHIADVI